MSLPFPPPHPAGLALRVLNALLRREDWARHRLVAHAGKTLRLAAGGPWQLQATISSEGLLQAADAAIVPDVVISLPEGRWRELPGLWRQGGAARLSSMAHIQGDAGLAQVVSDLAGNLRWDLEDELAHVVGDVAALRLAGGLRALGTGARATAGRARDNLAEFLGEESGLAVPRPDFDAWREGVETLRGRLDALERRISARAARAGRTC
ncbi:SCP2 sterol-binding domain-containing protein [Castellaniella sp. GW247-6E4]|uniref:ubiquinone biosynthesis accessory factor UbiJ n=1 Tax=Castellaniella sp. GW247-6E4 TaxID=3140380 RepID=UPI0033150748